MVQLIKQIWITKDISSMVLLGTILGVALWIVALPFSTTVQDTYLKRFHLDSKNFVAWAVQQPVPAMYNFENRVCFSDREISETEFAQALVRAPDEKLARVIGPVDEETDSAHQSVPVFKTINHFPTRAFTFADAIYEHKENLNGFVYMTTRYRGRELRSVFQITPVADSEFEVKRLHGKGVVQ
ncbi:MAG: hypothetical protein AB8B55_09065 [Mariniblastus sp.]